MKISVYPLGAVLLFVASGFVSIPAQAQEKAVPPPPKLEKLEEGPDSDIKLVKPETNKTKMVEKRENGKVTQVRVRTGKSSYVVKSNPNDQAKGTLAGDANRAAQWTVMEFGGAKEGKEAQSLPVLPKGPHTTSKLGTTKTEDASASASAAASASASMPVKK